jgi:hypothetical protein
MTPNRTPKLANRAGRGDALDRLVVSANPLTDHTLHAANLGPAFDQLGENILAGARRRPQTSRPYRRRASFVVAFAASLLAVTAALGGMYTTHTGFFPSTVGTENNTSEFLRTDAPDFPPLVTRLVKGIPFPPGDSAVSRVAAYVRQRQPGADGVANTVQAAGVQATFSLWAVCAWRGYWLQEHAVGNSVTQASAAWGLREVATSDAIKNSDSFASTYLSVANSEAAGDASASADFENFYRVSCAGQPQPWATK